jgi:aminoglycoside phosphotransferase (APT) family kinase protein
MDLQDRPGPLRPDDAFDVAKADAFLKLAIPDLRGTPEVRQFPGGASNLTYLLAYPDRELILRRPPPGTKPRSAHDMIREARVIAALRPVYPWAPRILAVCGDEGVLGAPFFAMARIPGIILRRDLPPGLRLDREGTRRLCLEVLDRLVDLHRVDWRGAGLADLGRGEGYVQRQVEGWMARYRAARTADAADFEAIMAWLWRTRPVRDAATCVIHNDYRFDNVVLDPEDPAKVVGVLDWEMATLGDPLMDLGNTLAYWVQADDDRSFLKLRRQPTHLPGMLTRADVIDHYASRTGLDTSGMRFYLAFGLFRLAAIAQQIYARYAQGQTTNPEFAGFAMLTHILEGRCKALMREAP